MSSAGRPGPSHRGVVSPHCTVSFSRAFPKAVPPPADPAAAGYFHTNVLRHLRVLETKLSFPTHLLTRLYSLACDGSPACPVPPTRTRNHGTTCTPLTHRPSASPFPAPHMSQSPSILPLVSPTQAPAQDPAVPRQGLTLIASHISHCLAPYSLSFLHGLFVPFSVLAHSTPLAVSRNLYKAHIQHGTPLLKHCKKLSWHSE